MQERKEPKRVPPNIDGLLPEKYDPSKDPDYKYKTMDYIGGKKTAAFYAYETFKEYPENPNYVIGNLGTCISLKRNKKLNHKIDEDGYLRVYLGETAQNKGVHKAIMETFSPNPDPEKYDQINHIDGIKTNNYYISENNTNLEWSNAKENINKAIENGLRAGGQYHPRAQCTNEQADKICMYISQGYNGRHIAYLMDMPYDEHFQDRISKIRKGESWNEYAKKYGIGPKYKWNKNK